MKESFLKFLEEHERKLEELITEDVSEEMEDFMEDNSEEPVIVKKTVSPRIIPKPKIVPKKIINESTFSFCTSCGSKLPSGINGKFCPFCGKQTLMITNGVTKTASKVNRVSETIDYASNLLDDEPLQQSRLMEYIERNPVRNPISEMLKNNQNMGESTMDRASDLLEGTSDIGTGKLLEMPDLSHFMTQKPKEDIIQENIAMAEETGIQDPMVLAQMKQLGLI